ncbi:MAG: LamG domain-containing protein [Magnetococcales bacterium]|nr:LamG domain-containing protein [Magnetococcales bacterium]
MNRSDQAPPTLFPKGDPRHPARGSMLVWLSFAMVALGSVIAVGLPRVAGMVDRDKVTANERVMTDVRAAIEGFAAANYRLPCPDTNGDGVENCPLTSTTSPAGNVPYRSIGYSSGRDAYGNLLRYAPYVGTIASTAADETDNLANTAHTSSTFCAALSYMSALTSFSSPTAKVHTTDSAGTTATIVPFVVASPGPKDANRNGVDGLFDGNNETSATYGTRRYDLPSRPVMVSNPPATTDYDDQTIESSFDRTVTVVTGQSAAFKALYTRLFPSGCGCSGGTVSDPVSSGQMVAYYKLEDTLSVTGDKVCDASGNNNYGTFTTPLGSSTIVAPTLAANRSSVASKAMVFAQSGATNNGVVIPESVLNNMTNGTFSVSFWAYPTANSSGTLISAYGSSSNEFNIARAQNGNNRPLTVTIKGSSTITGSANFNQNNWYHIVLTRNGSTGAVVMYVNGTSDASGTPTSGTVSVGTNRFTLGLIYNGTSVSGNWKGYLDDLVIYSKVLSSSEVSTLYSAASP